MLSSHRSEGGGEHRRFCREKVMAGRLLFADSEWPVARDETHASLEGGWAGKVLTFGRCAQQAR